MATIFGTGGNDTIRPFFSTTGQFTTTGPDAVFGEAGNDEVQGAEGNDTLFGGNDNDYLGGNADNDSLLGEAGDDTLAGGPGADTLDGGTGFNWADYNGLAPFVGATAYLAVFAGNVNAGAAAGDVYSGIRGVHGTDYNDVLGASYAASRLRGDDGDDVLVSGAGADTLEGGEGRDYAAYNGIYYSYAPGAAGVRASLAAPWLNTGEAAGDAYVSIENLSGTGGGDTLVGDAGANVLLGLDGDDLLEGQAGADTIDGGAGVNTVSYFDAGAVSVDLLNGAAADGYGTIDALSNLRDVNGSNAGDFIQGNGQGNLLRGLGGDDGVFGHLGGDTLEGAAGRDTLDGGAGDDRLVGGADDDVYVVDAAGDRVVEAAGAGTDQVRSAVTLALAANVEDLILTGTANLAGTGNALANHLGGTDGANRLDGRAGADTMVGGTGNDTYVVDVPGDVVIELAGGGTADLVLSGAAFALGAEVERLTLTGTLAVDGTGNALANTITGNAAANLLSGGDGNDILQGGGGADTMEGGNGNDVYTVDDAGDVVVELAGEGTADLVRSGVTFALGAEVERLTLTGALAVDGAGNALANALTGNAAANLLSGGDGRDTVYGGDGADTLLGGAGADVLRGDAGADAFRLGAAAEGGDVVLGFASGSDRFEVSAAGFGGGLSAGALAAGRFAQNTSGLASSPAGTGQFVHETDAGRLWWDADGAGGAARQLVATLSGNPALAISDIAVIG